MPTHPASTNQLILSGNVAHPCQLDQSQLSAFSDGQVPDISQVDPARQGTAIELQTLVEAAGPTPECDTLVIVSQDGFQATVSLSQVAGRAFIIYALNDSELPTNFGGPFRFWIPDAAACGQDAIDACTNVKHVAELRFTSADPQP